MYFNQLGRSIQDGCLHLSSYFCCFNMIFLQQYIFEDISFCWQNYLWVLIPFKTLSILALVFSAFVYKAKFVFYVLLVSETVVIFTIRMNITECVNIQKIFFAFCPYNILFHIFWKVTFTIIIKLWIFGYTFRQRLGIQYTQLNLYNNLDITFQNWKSNVEKLWVETNLFWVWKNKILERNCLHKSIGNAFRYGDG